MLIGSTWAVLHTEQETNVADIILPRKIGLNFLSEFNPNLNNRFQNKVLRISNVSILGFK